MVAILRRYAILRIPYPHESPSPQSQKYSLSVTHSSKCNNFTVNPLFNKFFPPNRSDDLCHFFCLYPSSLFKDPEVITWSYSDIYNIDRDVNDPPELFDVVNDRADLYSAQSMISQSLLAIIRLKSLLVYCTSVHTYCMNDVPRRIRF